MRTEGEALEGSLSHVKQRTANSLVDRVNILAYVHLRNIHNSTGAGRVARQLTEHLALRDDVNLRVLADEGDKRRILPLVSAAWSEFRYHTFTAETTRQQARWFFLDSPQAEAYWPEAQIVFCTAESYVPTRSARLVVTAHDAGYFELDAHTRDIAYWKTRLKWELLYKKLVRRVDMFHVVSQFSAERLGHFFPEIKSRIRWIHNGVTPHFFQQVTEKGLHYVDALGLSSRQFVLVPGGLHYRKNAELILEAIPMLLKRFPELVIAIVNHSNPKYIQKARALGERVQLLGFVPDEALHALYSAATVVWFPSRYEGFGLPVIEAMACGASVVASNSSSIPEIAGEAGLLVDPASSKVHAEAIGDLLLHDATREWMSAAGRTRARRFTWTQSADDLRRHLGSLL